MRFLQQLLDTSLIHVNRGLVSAVTAGKRSDAIAAIWGVILCLICPLHIQWILESDAVVSALVRAHFSILNSGSLSLKATDLNRVLRKSESQGRINRNRIFGCPLPCLTIISMACHISRLNMNNIKNVVLRWCTDLLYCFILPFSIFLFYVFIYKLKCTTHPSSRVLFLSNTLNIKELSITGCMAYTLSNRSNVLFSAQYGDCVTGIV